MDAEENNVFRLADLYQPISEHVLRLVDQVTVSSERISLGTHKIFYREARPPSNHFIKCDCILLHGQSFTSANWLDKRTLQTLAAAGYRAIAIDQPGSGQTAGTSLPHDQKPLILKQLIDELGLDRPVLVSPSMSGAYSLPLLMRWPDSIRALIAIAPSNSADYGAEEYARTTVPCLIVVGDRDTSLGVSAAYNLKSLAYGRLFKMNAGHACYLQNPAVFHTACLNFIDLVRTHSSSPITTAAHLPPR